ncbi:MAG: hypothetical protein JWN99_510, partial [Ilumatobacteraceae bacterium]|nr:hypothetical protein [Ilumatobacteraceae bacterium]
FHHPAHFAKQLTSLDVVSGGRAMAGMGAGWDADESAAFGIAFPPLGQRMDQLDEAMSIVSLMLREERPTFTGQHYSIDQPVNLPRPIGTVPIVIGGSGEKRTLPLAAKHADICNVLGEVDVLRHKFDVLADCLEAAGRARDACQPTSAISRLAPDLTQAAHALEAHAAAGSTAVVHLSPPDTASVEALGRVFMDVFPD